MSDRPKNRMKMCQRPKNRIIMSDRPINKMKMFYTPYNVLYINIGLEIIHNNIRIKFLSSYFFALP